MTTFFSLFSYHANYWSIQPISIYKEFSWHDDLCICSWQLSTCFLKYLCVYVSVPTHEHVCTHVPLPSETRRGSWILWKWVYRSLCTVQHGSSAIAIHSLNCWVISPALYPASYTWVVLTSNTYNQWTYLLSSCGVCVCYAWSQGQSWNALCSSFLVLQLGRLLVV